MKVLITGARGGLGTNVTRSFLASGATVIGVSRSISDSDFPHPRFRALPAELTRASDAERLIEDAGPVDAAVHLVGGFAGGLAAHETPDAILDKMWDLNFRSAFHLFQALIPRMRMQRNGCLLAVGSRSAQEPAPGSAVYAATKSALVSFIRSVASENAAFGIRANILLPGTLDTGANRQAGLSNLVDPDQVAELLVSLAGSRLTHVNGAVIPVLGAAV